MPNVATFVSAGDGAAIPAGVVGEIIQSRSAFTPTSNTISIITSVTLSTGLWKVNAAVQFSKTGITVSAAYCNFSINPVNDTAQTSVLNALTYVENSGAISTSFDRFCTCLSDVIIKSDGSNLFYYNNGSWTQYRTGTALYLKAILGVFTGTASSTENVGNITAIRIA